MIKPTTALGQPAMWLRAPDGAQATVLLHGATLVSWIPAGGVERLYLSPLAEAGPGKAVRGGVPVIFPQFEQRGPLPRHGFARNRDWQWVEGAQRGGAVIGVLRLADDAATRAIWPHAFEAELSFSLSGQQLDVELAITNTGDAPFDFSAALHSYLLVGDLQRTQLGGLLGANYTDSLTGRQQQQELDPFGFAGEIDRIYWGATGAQHVASPAGRLLIDRQGFDDVVVWNPGPTKAAAMADLPDDDWLQMLCVEAAQIGEPVTLAAGQEWVARQGFKA
jgi:glucose-6-phosphate 1-epimerase